MARHEGKFEAAAEGSVDLDELLGVLRTPAPAGAGQRREAIARCLSGSEGWRDAAATLGGAFAAPAKPSRLTDNKE